MFKRFIPVSLVAVLVLAACASSGFSSQAAESAQNVSLAQEVSDINGDPPASSQSVQERVVLRSASLQLVVADVEETLTNVLQMAGEMGGWVVESSSYRTTTAADQEITQGSITIRVPAERFEEALESLRNQALSVESQNISGQDVTQEYVDLTSQLTNLEAAETQLQTIMESAETTEDVLAIHNELVRVRGQIENIRGRIRYYDEASAFSSISVTLIPEELEHPPEIEIGGWNPARTIANALQALIRVIQLGADLLIWVGVLVFPFAISAWLIWRFIKRRGIRSKEEDS